MRHKVGMVFQYPEHQLFEETIAEDIAFGPKNLGLSADEVDERVREAMKFVGLDYDTYAERSPFHLSGEQMRRVADVYKRQVLHLISMLPSSCNCFSL